MRKAEIKRTTTETDISLLLGVDGLGNREIATGCGFLDHMLELFAAHGGFDLCLSCKGDTDVDFHHTVEDCGIALGEAFRLALGDKRGIKRYGSRILPMDEALILTAIDLSGRSVLVCDVNMPSQKIGSFDTELVKEFLLAFCRSSGATLHVKQFSGENAHHIAEAIFKSLSRSLAEACVLTGSDEIPSTKGAL